MNVKLKVTQCDLPGLLLIDPEVFGDQRGFFMELWNAERYRAIGLNLEFVQDNISFSRQGTLRGLHYQKPRSQGKMVSVLAGAVFDVAVDLRRSSPTFGQSCFCTLSSENRRQFYLPPGFGHGFVVTSETALFYYKCTEYYSPKDEITVRWNDPTLGIRWPVSDPILSGRDAAAPLLAGIPPERLFD